MIRAFALGAAAGLLVSTPVFAAGEDSFSEPVDVTESGAPSENDDAFEHDPLTADVAARLTPEQLTEILVERERSKNGGTTAIVGAGGFFVAVIGVAFLVGFVALRMFRTRHESIRLAIEKGSFSPEILAPLPRAAVDLRRGVLFSAVGVGAGLVLLALSGELSVASLGLLPLAVGFGFLIVSRVGRAATVWP